MVTNQMLDGFSVAETTLTHSLKLIYVKGFCIFN